MKNKKPKTSKLSKKFSFLEVLLYSITAFAIGSITPYSELITNPETFPVTSEESHELSVCFSPNLKCQQKIIYLIKSAKHSIRIQAYSFTDPLIADALLTAKSNGVDVEIILDKSNKSDKRSKASLVASAGIPVYIDSPAGIAHNKVIIIDANQIITGSYNFSAAAYIRNAENLIVIPYPKLAQQYLANWQYRKDLSTPFGGTDQIQQ